MLLLTTWSDIYRHLIEHAEIRSLSNVCLKLIQQMKILKHTYNVYISIVTFGQLPAAFYTENTFLH